MARHCAVSCGMLNFFLFLGIVNLFSKCFIPEGGHMKKRVKHTFISMDKRKNVINVRAFFSDVDRGQSV